MIFIQWFTALVLSIAGWQSEEACLIAYPSAPDFDRLAVFNLNESEAPLMLTEDRVDFPVWSPSGDHIAYLLAETSSLFVIDADGSNPREVATGVHRTDRVAWSPDGQRLAFAVRVAEDRSVIHIVDLSGEVIRVLGREDKAHYATPQWSSDGQQIAYTVFWPTPDLDMAKPANTESSGLYEVHVTEVDGNEAESQLIAENRRYPQWSPDGETLVYESMSEAEAHGLYRYNLATGQETPLTLGDEYAYTLPMWSPDGLHIASLAINMEREAFITVMDANGDHDTVLSPHNSQVYLPEWSPDSRHLITVSSEDLSRHGLLVSIDGDEAPEVLPIMPSGSVTWSPGCREVSPFWRIEQTEDTSGP